MRFKSTSLSATAQEYTLDKVPHIPQLREVEHKGKFRRILVTRDKAVFFFEFESSEMKPASKARRSDFAPVFEEQNEVFPPVVGLHSLDISVHISVLHMAQSEASSALNTAYDEMKKVRDKVATALSRATGDKCPEELLKEIKGFTESTLESVAKLKDELCDNVTIPEILTTSCLTEKLKKCLEPSFIVCCEGGGGSSDRGLFSLVATSKEDLRIYHKEFIRNGRVQGASIMMREATDSDSDDEDKFLAGCAIEVKPAVGNNFMRVQPQLLRNMERVATDLAYKAVTNNASIFAEIVIYGGIIEESGSKVQPSMLIMDFVEGASRFKYQMEPLPINDFFNRVIDLLQPK